MKIISYDELTLMDENEIIWVKKNVLYIQIVKYESLQYEIPQFQVELEILMKTLSKIFKIEQEIDRPIECIEMTAADIQKCFIKDEFPRSSFVQYK